MNKGGANQLKLDFENLKTFVKEFGEKYKDSKQLANFTDYIKKIMTKTDNILKLLINSKDNFNDQYRTFFEDSSYQDFKKLVAMKGYKEEEFPELRKYFINKWKLLF